MRLGEHTIGNGGADCSNDNSICNFGVQDFDVDEVISHHMYNKPSQFQNDIALVKIKHKISINGK